MVDGRGVRLAELATRIGGRRIGEDRPVTDIRSLEAAGPDELSFVHSGAHRDAATASRAGALLIPESLVEAFADASHPLLVVEDSRVGLARAIEVFHPKHRPAAGVHSTAVIADDATIDPTAHVGPYAVVGEGSRVGADVVLEAHVVIGRDVVVGDGGWLHPGVVLYDGTHLGERVEIHSGTVVGADGFGYATSGGIHHKVPQVGHVEVGDDVEIGANSAIDRALLETTRIGPGTKIDNLVQVGHNVRTGKGCLLCGQAGIAGTTVLDDYVVLGGQAGAIDHVRLGTGVQVAAKSAVMGDIEAGRIIGGIPATDLGHFRRQAAASARLPELVRRLRRLEKRLDALSSGDAPAD
ncbi:MAG: UDP-3-O-(3-hydroxymyristoyl)glucosamine N-acyltransferase [Acidobacteriota bacterium]